MINHARGKSLTIHKAILKYGIDNFIVDVEYFSYVDKQFLLDLEEALISKFDCLSPKGYNICNVGRSRAGIPMSQEAKNKISVHFLGKKKPRASVEKSARSRTGQKRSEETKRKMAEAKLGKKRKPHSPETIQKMKDAAQNRKNP